MRPSKDKYFIDMAVLVSTRGTCLRRKVGCVLVNSKSHVIATGYNGVATGLPHCNSFEPENAYGLAAHGASKEIVEAANWPNACAGSKLKSGEGLDSCQAIHGEQNALLQCNDVYKIDVVYVTAKPCVSCMKLFMNTSCKRIVYLEDYPHTQTEELAHKAGIILEKFYDDTVS